MQFNANSDTHMVHVGSPLLDTRMSERKCECPAVFLADRRNPKDAKNSMAAHCTCAYKHGKVMDIRHDVQCHYHPHSSV
jgi:hypothetical protein